MIIHAKDANEKTKQSIIEYTTDELESIESDIIHAIDEGEYEIVCDKLFMRTTIDALRTLEYKVTETDRGVDGTTTINWE